MKYKDKAIVLHARNYGESDRIVTLFLLQGGKRSAIAKGARVSKKRFSASLEIGSIVEILYRESAQRELLFLEEASLTLPKIPEWRASWKAIATASYALELSSRLLAEGQESPSKFELLESFLSSLKEEGAKEALFAFETEWLKHSGWEPNLKQCGFCGLEWKEDRRENILDHYWEHILSKPLASKQYL